MPTIFDLINAKAIAAYVANSPSNAKDYLGATLFPAKKKMGLDLAWIKGSKGLPVSLRASAFDAKATLRDRIGISKVETEMPFFREAMRIGEKERQDLLRLMDSNKDEYIMPMIADIYNDVAELVKGARVIPERMIMQLLSTGKIQITDNRQPLDYDYKMPTDHMETLTGSAVWSDPDSTPIQDIQRWIKTIRSDTGTTDRRAICSLDTWDALLTHPSIRNDMFLVGGQNAIITDSMLEQYLRTKLKVSVSVYDQQYKDTDGSQRLFYPNGHFTLIPDGNLGNTWYGTTPEEADLISGATSAQVSIVDTGVAVTTIKEPHPVNVETIVSEIVLPSFENIDTVFIAKVL